MWCGRYAGRSVPSTPRTHHTLCHRHISRYQRQARCLRLRALVSYCELVDNKENPTKPMMITHHLLRTAFSSSPVTRLHWCSSRNHVYTKNLAPFSTEIPRDSATIIQGPSLLTATGVFRPSPSLFYLPGLRSLPFWTAPEPPDSSSRGSPQNPQQLRRHRIAFNDPIVSDAVNHLESNFNDIRAEYFSAVLGQGNQIVLDNGEVTKPLEPDYDVESKGVEHAGKTTMSFVNMCFN